MELSKIENRLQLSCAKREYCVSDIYPKALKLLDGDSEAALAMVERLKEAGFVDDARYAVAFARDKSSLCGWGPLKIRMMLRSKRISEADIDAALREVDESRADETLRRLLKNKKKLLDGDPEEKLKLIRFALGRGYEYDDVKRIISEL